jgi:hypothetical protein
MKVIEVEGWEAGGEYVSASATPRDGESDAECLQRLISEENIVEIGSTNV